MITIDAASADRAQVITAALAQVRAIEAPEIEVDSPRLVGSLLA